MWIDWLLTTVISLYGSVLLLGDMVFGMSAAQSKTELPDISIVEDVYF